MMLVCIVHLFPFSRENSYFMFFFPMEKCDKLKESSKKLIKRFILTCSLSVVLLFCGLSVTCP